MVGTSLQFTVPETNLLLQAPFGHESGAGGLGNRQGVSAGWGISGTPMGQTQTGLG